MYIYDSKYIFNSRIYIYICIYIYIYTYIYNNSTGAGIILLVHNVVCTKRYPVEPRTRA